jgi:hypothetical protein
MERVKPENMRDDSPESGAGGRGRVDFTDLVGSWTPDPAFEEILAAQRQKTRCRPVDWQQLGEADYQSAAG